MNPGDILLAVLAVFSVLLAVQSGYSTALMLYAWEDEEKNARRGAPATYEPPQHSFTVMLPAKNEEDVIQETVQRVVNFNYPAALTQVLIIIDSSDSGTIAKVKEKLAQLLAQGITHIRLVTYSEKPINKPHGLNIGLAQATGDVVTIFDAEDEPHPDILQVVNTLMVREGVPVVQCGVQLMNYADKWFSALNVLEYFFWFRSRMHYHASAGSVTLGGNTVFMTRALLTQLGGWDQNCLTEDADIGIAVSALGLPIRVMYDDDFVTREETPPTVTQFIKQRTRWDQGFLQVLGKGTWRTLPTFRQKALALYTLSFPLLQAVLAVYLPISLIMMFFVKLPIVVAMISILPLYAVVVQYIISVVGLYEFTAVHKLKPSPFVAVRLLVAYLPYQWLLSYAAFRAVRRHLQGVNTWEKTKHIGAHRVGETALPQPAAAFPATVAAVSMEDGALPGKVLVFEQERAALLSRRNTGVADGGFVEREGVANG